MRKNYHLYQSKSYLISKSAHCNKIYQDTAIVRSFAEKMICDLIFRGHIGESWTKLSQCYSFSQQASIISK